MVVVPGVVVVIAGVVVVVVVAGVVVVVVVVAEVDVVVAGVVADSFFKARSLSIFWTRFCSSGEVVEVIAVIVVVPKWHELLPVPQVA